MKFRTIVDLPAARWKLEPSMKMMCLGSCFAQEIGSRMQVSLPDGQVMINPNGVLYNPASISNVLNALLDDSYDDSEMVFLGRDGFWHSWMHTNKFYGNDKATFTTSLESIRKQAKSFLKQADVLVITWGTSHVFSLRGKVETIVGNCHKEHPALFQEKRLTVGEILADYCRLFDKIRGVNKGLEIVLSVSPYRYSKLGYAQSNTSKAILLLAAERMSEIYGHVSYFPAYEILKDELRDYRFYAADMLHPSDQAVDYVWERFRAFCFSDAMNAFSEDMLKLNKALQHRMEKASGAEHERFAKRISEMRTEMERKWGMFL